MKKRQEKINDALLKVALGCKVAEVTEEYAEVDGELKLTKRKETKKDIPPDLKAVQLLLSGKEDGTDYAAMSDEALEAEKNRLLAMLSVGADKQEAVAKRGSEKEKSAVEKIPQKRKMKRAGSRLTKKGEKNK